MNAESLVKKAARLYTDGKVRKVSPGIYAVIGDNGTYLVCLADRVKLALAVPNDELPPIRSCTCPARDVCSHMIAAERVRLEDESDERSPSLGSRLADARDCLRQGDQAGAIRWLEQGLEEAVVS